MNWPSDDLEQPPDTRPDYPDPLDDGDRDGGALEDANEEAMDVWADKYDELDGAPEGDEDY